MVLKYPRGDELVDEEYAPCGPATVVVYSSTDPTWTGLYDAAGVEIMRLPNPVGFRFGETDE